MALVTNHISGCIFNNFSCAISNALHYCSLTPETKVSHPIPISASKIIMTKIPQTGRTEQ